MDIDTSSPDLDMDSIHCIQSSQQQSQLIMVDRHYLQSLKSKINDLSQQISYLQSTNTALTKTVSSLTDTMNNNKLSIVVSNLESVCTTLTQINPSQSSKSNKITSYFQSTNPIAPTTSNSPTNKLFRVKSTTLSQFVKKEESDIFSLTKCASSIIESDNVRLKFQCILCNKYQKQSQGRCKYIEGETCTQSEIKSESVLKSIKRGIEKHVNATTIHLSSIALSQSLSKPSQALYIKIETIYFMLKRSSPLIVFEEILVFLQRLIDFFKCDEHPYCLDIGDKQHSVAEAKRIIDIFRFILKKQTITVIQSPSYGQLPNIIFFSISTDGWSKGKFISRIFFFFFYFFLF